MTIKWQVNDDKENDARFLLSTRVMEVLFAATETNIKPYLIKKMFSMGREKEFIYFIHCRHSNKIFRRARVKAI